MTTNVLLTVAFQPLVAVLAPLLVNPKLAKKLLVTNSLVVYIPLESALTITFVPPTHVTLVPTLAASNLLNVMTQILVPSIPVAMGFANMKM